MNKRESTDVDLLDYLSKKSFEELSFEEKRIVLQFISQEEYKILRETIAQTTIVLENEGNSKYPNSNIKNTLLLKFKEKNKKDKSILDTFVMLANSKVPIYQPVLGITILVMVFFFITSNNSEPVTTTIIKSIDTVYVAQEQNKSSSIDIQKEISINTAKDVKKKKQEIPKEINTSVPIDGKATINVYEYSEEQLKSNTMREDSILASFFTIPQ